MKKNLFIFFIFLFSLNSNLFSRVIVDKIVARVNGVNILKSELDKPRIGNNGRPYTLDDLIMEEVLFQKAADPQNSILPTQSEIDRQITTIKISNGLQDISEEGFEKQLKDEGFSIQEYRNQMGRILASEKIKHLEINEKLVVTSQQVEDYYKKNPEYSKESCWIKIADVPKDMQNKKIDKNKLLWDDLGWVSKKDVASDLDFIFDMEKGDISEPVKRDDKFQAILLVDKKVKRLKTLEERYIDIENLLQNEKREKLEREFEVNAKKDATIVYL